MSEKNLKATPKRVKEAREEGNVAKADSVPHLLAFGAVFELAVATSDRWLLEGPMVLGSYISRLGATDAASRLTAKDVLVPLAGVGISLVLVALMLAALLALLGNVAQTGVVVATKGIAKLERLDPIAHFKNFFSAEQLQNVLMGIVKATAILGCMVYGVVSHLDALMYSSGTTLTSAARTVLEVALRCERMAMLLLIVFVFIDWFIRKQSHAKQLKMSRDEVEREQKDQFGDKHVRQGRNAFRNDMLAGELTENTRKANVVVTNPTHFAVALIYDPKKFPLPVVVARGMDRNAALMRKVARDSNVPIVRSVQLARTLYSTGRAWRPVPRLTLRAVAAVFRVVEEIKAGERHIDDYIELFDDPYDDRHL